MDKIKRIKELTELLQKATYAYYGQDNPVMSDKKYDDLYDELLKLEYETGCILAGSPTQKVQGYVSDGFKKVKHSKPMLSANKTKNTKEIKKFINNKDFYCSYKLDGLTLVVKYADGKFIQGITRGNGLTGEDVTEQCKFIKNLPMQIPNKNSIELRGECVISWEEFRRINRQLDEPYSHPRSLAAGTLRNLDLNVVRERNLSFIVFEIVSPTFTSKLDGMKVLEELGFECVGRCIGSVENCVEGMQPEFYKYPTDGLIFEINNSELSKMLGTTAHHECCRMALKWEDELYETRLKNIEWNTSKTGLINPVAVFEPVDLDGSITNRATLHNVSYIEDLKLGDGDIIRIYKANMVIPKIHDNLTNSNTWKLPDKCPCCGGNVEIHNENGSKTLHCMNPDCKAKLLGKLVHFVSKNALNIDGLSEQTLQKFIDLGWLTSFQDIYFLSEYKEEMYKLNGFGKKSVDKLLLNIEKSRNTTLDRFIYGLCIPLIGRTASKTISSFCKKIAIRDLSDNIYVFYKYGKFDANDLDGFGEVICKSLNDYIAQNKKEIIELSEEFNIESDIKKPDNITDNLILSNKVFVITGSLNHYKNRNNLISVIEQFGGKVSGSVSSKTSYLINNDVTSTSGKNAKAKQLNIPIISEEDFIRLIS